MNEHLESEVIRATNSYLKNHLKDIDFLSYGKPVSNIVDFQLCPGMNLCINEITPTGISDDWTERTVKLESSYQLSKSSDNLIQQIPPSYTDKASLEITMKVREKTEEELSLPKSSGPRPYQVEIINVSSPILLSK